MSFWNVWTFLAGYYAIGLGVHLFAPKPPRAKEAFDMCERSHPAGYVIVAVLVSTFWPLVAFGTLLRFLRGGK